MNLRVDLILESEQRSGSPVNVKSVTRVATFIVPAIIAFIVIVGLLNLRAVSSTVKNRDKEWKQKSTQQEDAIELRAAVESNQAMWDEIETWQSSRTDVALLLAALQREVPDSVQMVDLKFSDVFVFEEAIGVVRRFKLTLNGLADGFKAKDAVEKLTRNLQTAPDFTNMIESASVPPGAFAADRTPGAPKSRRVFRIECTFYQKPFE